MTCKGFKGPLDIDERQMKTLADIMKTGGSALHSDIYTGDESDMVNRIMLDQDNIEEEEVSEYESDSGEEEKELKSEIDSSTPDEENMRGYLMELLEKHKEYIIGVSWSEPKEGVGRLTVDFIQSAPVLLEDTKKADEQYKIEYDTQYTFEKALSGTVKVWPKNLGSLNRYIELRKTGSIESTLREMSLETKGKNWTKINLKRIKI
uniref:Uncharacterized protein n=1 Tax=Hymenopteran almendra-related virus OKIAV1 TaxID=2746366 RepID=A0A7D7EZ85_9RHAB|nr:hypothetical protein [Hymenopteran almendra-related virus OKIAV1]